ncbi:isochorismatase family protein [Arthrobacter sp. HY1533]|uniref:isochorismatase family protein n=1 Tax=Arthrobacter sp. HY1533 TaxID=2970919 RepID=UPI0022B9F090|nr:isochorismatase family protein [Arthrobacter sp. HY1533]
MSIEYREQVKTTGLLDIRDSLVLVIDAQENFYRAHRTDVDRETLAGVFKTVAWVAGAAGSLGVPAVATEEDSSTNGRTAGNIRSALAPGTAMLPKHAFSAADNPEILAEVQRHGRSTIILLGLETDICVAHSALQLQALGYRVVAIHDALFSPGRAHHNGLVRMQNAGIEQISAKELLYDWVRTVENIRRFSKDNPSLATPPGFSL